MTIRLAKRKAKAEAAKRDLEVAQREEEDRLREKHKVRVCVGIQLISGTDGSAALLQFLIHHSTHPISLRDISAPKTIGVSSLFFQRPCSTHTVNVQNKSTSEMMLENIIDSQLFYIRAVSVQRICSIEE